MRAGPIGLADLAAAVHALRPAFFELSAIAKLVGLVPSEVATMDSPPPVAPMVGGSPLITLSPEPAGEASAKALPAPLWPRPWISERRFGPPQFDAVPRPTRLVEVRGAALGAIPDDVASAEPLTFDIVGRRLPPPLPSLMPKAQYRALSIDLLTGWVPGAPDVLQLVDDLARRRLPRRIARRRRRGIAGRTHLLIDTSDGMRLLQQDAVGLVASLRAVAGTALAQPVTIMGPRSSLMSRFASGDSVVAVSDLGLGARPGLRGRRVSAWEAFARHLGRRNIRLTALIPFNRARWPARLSRRIRLVHWHRPGTNVVPTTPEQVQSVARALSAAAVIDPALLRTMRLEMLPGSDVGVEAEIASGPWVAGWNPRVLTFRSEWLLRFRDELAAAPGSLEEVGRIMQRQRPSDGSWDRVVFEEELVHLALQSDTASKSRLEASVARVVRSLFGRMRTQTSARWALCFVEELPESVRGLQMVQLLKAVAATVLNSNPNEVAEIVASNNAKWIMPDHTIVGLAWTGEIIMVREPAEIGDCELRVPATSPRVVIVISPDERRNRILRLTQEHPRGWTFASFLPRSIKTTNGAQYRLDEVDETSVWEDLRVAFEAQKPVRGVFKRAVRDGFVVDVGIDATCLGGRAGEMRNRVGETTDFIITAFEPGRRRVIVATVDEFRRSEARQAAMESLQHGQVAEVEVTQDAGNGLVVRLGAATGFLSRRELPPGLAASGELPKVGEKLTVRIVGFPPDKRHFYASAVAVTSDPWHGIETRYSVGDTVTATVSGSMVPDGLFVNLEPGLAGLVPRAELTNKDFQSGERVDAIIIDIDVPKRRMTFSMKAVAWARAGALHPIGSRVTGTIVKLFQHAALVELSSGLVGAIEAREISWAKRGKNSLRVLQLGQVLNAVVIGVDTERRHISLSLKQLTTKPWLSFAQRCPPGSIVIGTVASLKDYGAFVEVEPGVDGLLHITEMPERLGDGSSALRIGDKIEMTVISVETEKERLSLRFNRVVSKSPRA